MAIPERLARLETIELLSGVHPQPDDDNPRVCLMEAVAWLAGEPHSDHPMCACPVIGAFLRSLNDQLPDDLRQRLKPLIPRLIGSRSTDREALRRRAYLAADWAVRAMAPRALDVARLGEQAAALRALPEVRDRQSAIVARDAARKARAAYASYAADAAADAADAAYAAARRRMQEELLPGAISLVEKMLAISAPPAVVAEVDRR